MLQMAPDTVSLRQRDLDGGIWTSGRSQTLIHDISTYAELVANIMAKAEAVQKEPDSTADW